MRKLIFLRWLSAVFLYFAIAFNAFAEIEWNLSLGYGILCEGYQYGYDENNIFRVSNWTLGLELGIPLNDRMLLETGARYRNLYVTYTDYQCPGIEVPVKMGYNFKLSNKFSVRTSLGLSLGYFFDDYYRAAYDKDDDNGFSVGIEPSVTVYYRNFNIGFRFNSPILYNGLGHYRERNLLQVTMGLRFSTDKWKNVATGLEYAAIFAGAAADAYVQSQGGSSNFSSLYTQSDYDSDDYSTESTSNSSSSKNTAHNANWMKSNYQSMKTTYGNWESQLIHFKVYGGGKKSDIENAQKKMAEIRKTILEHGGSCSKSQMETWKPKYAKVNGSEVNIAE